jgi:leader peptidase (prepilin peptidase)/N-methyltransferase
LAALRDAFLPGCEYASSDLTQRRKDGKKNCRVNRMEHLHDLIVARPCVLALWVFFIGSAIGSFLNVVIYRLPRGMSLSHPGSRCPKCGHAIRWYHNLPIAGWLLLRGKCYDCNAPISPRYPLVELIVAAVFIAVAYVDVYLPMTEAGDPATPINSMALGISLLAFTAHAWLACSLLAAGLIRWDGQRVPCRLVVPAVTVAAAAAPFLDRARSWSLIAAAVVLILVTFRDNEKPRPSGRG